MRTLSYLWYGYVRPFTLGRLECLIHGHRGFIVAGAHICTNCYRVKEL